MRIIDPPQDKIYESWQPYVDFFYTDHRGWIMPDIEKIKSLANTHDFVIANCSSEHWGSERDFPLVARLHDLLAEHFNKGFVCLCHDPSDQLLRANILYFPFFAWKRQWQTVDAAQIRKNQRTYLYSNLNHFARDFRIANYLALKQKPWTDRCLVTLHNVVQNNHAYDGYLELTAAENLAWQQVRHDLPYVVSDGFEPCFQTKHPAFADAYLHIVSETTIKEKIFLTEKTWQTILAGQLFIVWGNCGVIQHLRDLGVDVFDDIIDHAYDEIANHRNRLECLNQELDRLAQLDWTNIYYATASRRLTNAHRFDSQEFISRYVDELKFRLPGNIL